jgi:hypothetical protein
MRPRGWIETSVAPLKPASHREVADGLEDSPAGLAAQPLNNHKVKNHPLF